MKYFLYPITWLFSVIVYIRNALYDWELLPSVSSALPIISVGNIQAGGTGKTPFVIALSKQLIANNIKPLIITRGYKRNTTHQFFLNDFEQYSAQEVGDEPYYIKQVLKDVPIIVDHNKKNAVKAANELKNIDCIILDDGFQSRYIYKDIDIVLTSFSQINNFSLMPFGSFREPISSLRRAHFIYKTKESNSGENNLKIEFILTLRGIALGKPDKILGQGNNVAFCGIANPEYFITSLKRIGIHVEQEIKFENHAKYDAKKYQKLYKVDVGETDYWNKVRFITTSKDYVKLEEDFLSEYAVYVLKMNFVLDDNRLLETIQKLIK